MMIGYRRMILNSVVLVPGMQRLEGVRSRLRKRELGTGGTSSARYCYSVWLRHLSMAAGLGLNTDPKDVAELGPGDSIGSGLAALLCGAERYSALDVVRHANPVSNALIFDELVELFQRRADIPDQNEFRSVGPRLHDYRFPAHILDEARMRRALEPARLARIREAVLGEDSCGFIRYHVPWHDPAVVQTGTQDLVFSQAVLEHVDALAEAYRAMRDWLKPGGYLSHQIDFKSHNWADTWDGHWRYGDLRWKMLRGRASWFINRQPYSEHLRLLGETGFRLLESQPVLSAPTYGRAGLAKRFSAMTEQDRRTSGAYIIAVPLDA